jgi:23S rRNA (adenine1618-N6)-methyltransferase
MVNLCPPIPGRADYLHYVADLLAVSNEGDIPTGSRLKGLDIGVGASCIYPIIGTIEYGWKFIGSDINPKSIASSQNIVLANSSLKNKIECRLQRNENAFFKGILKSEEYIDFSVCNPPFHTSAEEAQKGTQRKLQNLSGKHSAKMELNFAGVQKELVYKGGEFAFICQMIQESKQFEKQCFWFTTLVAKEIHLKGIYKALEKIGAQQVQTIPMGTGNKTSRIIAWTFLTEVEQKQWKTDRWRDKNIKRNNITLFP